MHPRWKRQRCDVGLRFVPPLRCETYPKLQSVVAFCGIDVGGPANDVEAALSPLGGSGTGNRVSHGLVDGLFAA